MSRSVPASGVAVHQRKFQRLHDLDCIAIALDPHGDPPVRLFQIFKNKLASPWPVEGKHHDSKRSQHAAQVPRNMRLHMATLHHLACKRAGHCPI